MRKLTLIISINLLLFMLFAFAFHRVSMAQEYRYHFAVDKPIRHYVVKPDFTSFQTNLDVANYGDPIYFQVKANIPNEFEAVIQDITVSSAGTPLSQTYLLPRNDSRHFRIEIRRTANTLELKDYTFDFELIQILPQKPTYSQQSITLEPTIHSYIIVSSTPDGNIQVDPKIALFQNTRGAVTLANSPAEIILLVQNRGKYLFPIEGKIVLTKSNGQTQTFDIPQTYIFANSQKNLSVIGNGDKPTLIIQPNTSIFEKYSLRTELTVLGTNTPTLYGQTTFYVFNPIVVILTLVILILLVVYIFFIGLHHT